MPRAEAALASPHVSLVGLRKAFGRTVAVDDFSIQVPRGSFTTLLGPSGCGKTTVLRMLAGFVEPDAGQVVISGVDQTDRPPDLRGVGMVFQDYALFPHMSVRGNLEYGLKMRRERKEARRTPVERTLSLLGLTGLAERYPHQLSGGQQQRVALGRALVLEPEVLLMDEPLSNLDARLRSRLRAELKDLQQELGITTIYVTHDQAEALSLSDVVVVMNEGRVLQAAPPKVIYRSPKSRFVAEFVGEANLLTATVLRAGTDGVLVEAGGRTLEVRAPEEGVPAPGAVGMVMVRPESVQLTLEGTSEAHGAWSRGAVVSARGYFGSFERYWLELEDSGAAWLADLPAEHSFGLNGGPGAGEKVRVTVRPGAASWLP